jgi:hypothetical protein
MDQRDKDDRGWQRLPSPSSIVDRLTSLSERRRALQGSAASDPSPSDNATVKLPRTAAAHGATGPELDRLSGAVRFMEQHCQPRRSSLWFATTDKGTSRSVVEAIGKRITKLQSKHGLPRYSATTFESRGGLHAHITFIGNRAIVQGLKSSTAFGNALRADEAIKPVTDANGLVRKYLAKERTPQAGYGREHVLGGRLKGSHQLKGGGDRVRLSEALKLDAINANYVKPWQHTNARRADKRKGYRLRGGGPLARAPRLAGQLPLLPELERPVSRLHDFGGGIVPAAVALELEHRRRQLCLSQREYAAKLGVSQGQYANARRGHDPLSAFAVNRARELPVGGSADPDNTAQKQEF